MKKFSVSVFSIILLICTMFVFTACDKKKEGLPDLADCEIGYKLPVYPGFEFDYKMNEGNIVHINQFDATLIAKSNITANEPVEGDFFKYDIEVKIAGFTDSTLAGKQIEIRLFCEPRMKLYVITRIKEDGTFGGSDIARFNSSPGIFTFYGINIK